MTDRYLITNAAGEPLIESHDLDELHAEYERATADGAALDLVRVTEQRTVLISQIQRTKTMDHYTPSSELQRVAEERQRNAERRRRWQIRFFLRFRRWPDSLRWKRPCADEHHGNDNRAKVPRYRGQYRGATLPEEA